MSLLPFRQVHLDFHTSPAIPDIAVDFDPQEFVRTLQAGHVNSVTVFAKCHHGYSYYPTQIGTPHPHLKRPDLLGEMIEACHAAGIRVPVYTTLTWDELAWATHPEWRHITPDGHVGWTSTPLKPGWKNLCMNTGYGDYVIAQIDEVLDLYDGDGIFVDIVRFMGAPCVCSTCLSMMQAEGVDPTDPAQLAAFDRAVERRFLDRCSGAIRAKDPKQSIFYNARLNIDWDPELGNRPELHDYTHLEIESLPGGFWGYDHFPLNARYFQTFGLEMLAMTGRFHTFWGDFGGLRNRSALAYEAYTALAHGAVVSIGDQLHPRGRLDPTVYARIGEVYAEVEKRERWRSGCEPIWQVAVFRATPQEPGYVAYCDAHWQELIERYDPAVLWSDISHPAASNLAALFADYYNRLPDGVVNDRFAQVVLAENRTDMEVMGPPPSPHFDFRTPEYSTFDHLMDEKWESNRGLAHSYSYHRNEQPENYLSVLELVRMLVDVVSKNGNLLLSFGPMADGTVPDLQRERLEGLGAWLSVNGEAIYGTRPWHIAEGRTRDGIAVRYTQKDGSLYATLWTLPAASEVIIQGLHATGQETVHLLGHAGPLLCRQESDGLAISLPSDRSEAPAYAFKIAPMPRLREHDATTAK